MGGDPLHPTDAVTVVRLGDDDQAGTDAPFAVSKDGGAEGLNAYPHLHKRLRPAREDLRERFETTVRGLGLEPNRWVDPGMALYPIPPPPPPPPELRIEVADAATFDDWHAGISYDPNFRRVYGPTLIEDPTFRLVVGYEEDQPVAGAAAILTGHTVGIYAVGTAQRARRRGFGQAMTWAAVQAGVEAGCRVAVLQSSEMAVSLYRRMGFVEVCRYVDYEPVEGSAGDPASPA